MTWRAFYLVVFGYSLGQLVNVHGWWWFIGRMCF